MNRNMLLIGVAFFASALQSTVTADQAKNIRTGLNELHAKVVSITSDTTQDAGKISRMLEEVNLINTNNLSSTVSILNELTVKPLVGEVNYSSDVKKLRAFFDITVDGARMVQKRSVDELYNPINPTNLLSNNNIAKMKTTSLTAFIQALKSWTQNYPA